MFDSKVIKSMPSPSPLAILRLSHDRAVLALYLRGDAHMFITITHYLKYFGLTNSGITENAGVYKSRGITVENISL